VLRENRTTKEGNDDKKGNLPTHDKEDVLVRKRQNAKPRTDGASERKSKSG